MGVGDFTVSRKGEEKDNEAGGFGKDRRIGWKGECRILYISAVIVDLCHHSKMLAKVFLVS